MKKLITMLSVVILMVGFASLLFAGCDDHAHHGGRRFRTKRDVVVVRHEKDNRRQWRKDEWKPARRHNKWENKRHDGRRRDKKSRNSKRRRR